MTESYRCDATKTLLHQPRELRTSGDAAAEAASGEATSDAADSGAEEEGEEEEVAFTGSQALWSAVVRAAELPSP